MQIEISGFIGTVTVNLTRADSSTVLSEMGTSTFRTATTTNIKPLLQATMCPLLCPNSIRYVCWARILYMNIRVQILSPLNSYTLSPLAAPFRFPLGLMARAYADSRPGKCTMNPKVRTSLWSRKWRSRRMTDSCMRNLIESHINKKVTPRVANSVTTGRC